MGSDGSHLYPTCSSRQCRCFSEIWLRRACFSLRRFSRDSVDQSSLSSSQRALSCGYMNRKAQEPKGARARLSGQCNGSFLQL